MGVTMYLLLTITGIFVVLNVGMFFLFVQLDKALKKANKDADEE